MTIPDASFFCSMHDVVDHGAERLCDDLLALGMTGVTVAVTYHGARDLRPRGSASRLIDFADGAQYFPATAPYPNAAQPWVPQPFADEDLLLSLRAATTSRGMRLTAWTVFCFQERIGREHPELCQRTVFGDPMTSDLCPANPVVRDFVLSLVADVAKRNPDALLAESLHYAPLQLTRRFVPLDAEARLAFGLCFCEHCVVAAEADGVEVELARRWAADTMNSAFAGERASDDAPMEHSSVADLVGGAVADLLHSRATVIATLVDDVAALVARSGIELRYLDQAVAEEWVLGPTRVDDALRSGVDVARVAASCSSYEVLGYGAHTRETERIIADYRAAIGPDGGMRVALRPAWPDCTTEQNLKEKVDAAIGQGAAGIDFYHYGFVSHDALARVAAVMAELT